MIELEWYHYLLALAGGGLAGVINTLAGSGSLVTLPLFVFLGLPANVANGTNRVGVVLQAMIGTFMIWRAGKLSLEGSLKWVLAVVIGAAIGAWIATQLDAAAMQVVIAVVMVLMLGLLLIKPKRWLREESTQELPLPVMAVVLILGVIGVYGGFIQAGFGVLMLAALVLGAGQSLVEANGIKLLATACFAIPVLAIFALQDQVHWGAGFLVASGQSFGAWVAARFAIGHPKANLWIRRLLIFIVVVALGRFGYSWIAPYLQFPT